MSLAIDVADVTRVLLADGWHDVHGSSFDVDSYEFADGKIHIHADGACPVGFNFLTDSGVTASGPLTALIALERAPR